MKKKSLIIVGLLSSLLCTNVYAANSLTSEESDFLSFGQREGFFFSGENGRYMDYYSNSKDSRYTTYYQDGRYYHATDYTYKDSQKYKHYVTIKYYYYENQKVYSITDYYYDDNGKKVYVKDDKDIRNSIYGITDVFDENNYKKRVIDNTTHYLYDDTYMNSKRKHYVEIDYYYENSNKMYTIKDYYYDADNNKSYMVNVDKKSLSKNDLKYYLEDYLKFRQQDSSSNYDYYYDSNGRKIYYDDYYYDRDGNKVYYGYYYDNNGKKIYYDDYYYDSDGKKVYYTGKNSRRYYYDDNRYTTERDYFNKIDDMSHVRPDYHNGQKYFGDETKYTYTYLKEDINYNTIADMFPADFAPNEKTWPKKAEFTNKKRDMAERLANQIIFERSYMGTGYFDRDDVNELLKRYFPKAYDESSSSKIRLQNFLYYFGFVDAFYEKFNDTNNIRGFLYNYGEPMYFILDNYRAKYYTDKDVNSMRAGKYKTPNEKAVKEEQTNMIKKPEKKGVLQDREYFTEKNKLIMKER